jgi:3-isopropylmalate/(R)-2-methylmalate dehydratase small subunit
MTPFKKLTSTAVPLPVENIDTDQIIPARFLKATDKVGFGDNLFRDWRYHPDGSLIEDFVLNDSTFKGQILLTGENFGSGSSREHAAWALTDYGFRVVVSGYFADIFKGNALNNGLLPIQLPGSDVSMLLEAVRERPELEFIVDLEQQTLSVPEKAYQGSFELDAYKKMCLLNGYDDIDFLISKKSEIEAFEKRD